MLVICIFFFLIMITRPTGHLTQYLESMEKIDQAISFFEKNNPESIELSVLVGGSRLPIVPPCFTYNTSCFMGFLGLRFNVFNPLSAKCVIFYHKNTFAHYVRKRNHKCFKLESDKGRRSRKARCTLGRGHLKG